jgi:GNAT superfamily N-acetyltransferase
MTTPLLRPLAPADVAPLVAAFSELGWPNKDVAQFTGYLAEARDGSHLWLVATVGDDVAGYGGLAWTSPYAPFAADGIPEVVDLNVLPQWRNRGLAGRLMDALESAAAGRSDTVGLGVGLYADYAVAMRMYLRRGYLPDGAGVVHRGMPVAPGAAVPLDDDTELKLTRQLR